MAYIASIDFMGSSKENKKRTIDDLMVVHINDFGDEYHNTTVVDEPDIVKRAKSLSKKYRNAKKYYEALYIYNTYMIYLETLYGKLFVDTLLMNKKKSRKIYTSIFIPSKPKVDKKNKKLRKMIKDGIFLSDPDKDFVLTDEILQQTERDTLAYLGYTDDTVAKDIPADKKPIKLTEDLIISEMKKDYMDRNSDNETLDILAQYCYSDSSKKKKKKKGEKNKNKSFSLRSDDLVPSIDMGRFANDKEYRETVFGGRKENNEYVINIDGRYMKGEDYEQYLLIKSMMKMGWNSDVFIDSKKDKKKNKAFKAILSEKKAKKKKKKEDKYYLSIVQDNNKYNSYDDFKRAMLGE
ncbi:MAG: hypothetical protein PHF63_00940 [Herbinix sp.]|nr:hypothetical protein [Herbinix sp.]